MDDLIKRIEKTYSCQNGEEIELRKVPSERDGVENGMAWDIEVKDKTGKWRDTYISFHNDFNHAIKNELVEAAVDQLEHLVS